MKKIVEKSNNTTYILNTGYWIDQKEELTTKEHTHEFVEMVYTFAGSSVHIVNNKRYTVKKGDLLFLNYNCTHAVETGGGLKSANIMFKLEYIDLSLKNGGNVFSLLDTDNFSDFQNMINKDNCKIHFSSDEREEFEMLLKRTIKEQNSPIEEVVAFIDKLFERKKHNLKTMTITDIRKWVNKKKISEEEKQMYADENKCTYEEALEQARQKLEGYDAIKEFEYLDSIFGLTEETREEKRKSAQELIDGGYGERDPESNAVVMSGDNFLRYLKDKKLVGNRKTVENN